MERARGLTPDRRSSLRFLPREEKRGARSYDLSTQRPAEEGRSTSYSGGTGQSLFVWQGRKKAPAGQRKEAQAVSLKGGENLKRGEYKKKVQPGPLHTGRQKKKKADSTLRMGNVQRQKGAGIGTQASTSREEREKGRRKNATSPTRYRGARGRRKTASY